MSLGAKAGQIGGNFNTLIMLRVRNIETANLLVEQLPMVNIASIVPCSSVADTNDRTDFADFSSRSEDRIIFETRPMLNASDLAQLPKGQASALLEGGQLYKLRIPLPKPRSDERIDVTAISAEMGTHGREGVDNRYLPSRPS